LLYADSERGDVIIVLVKSLLLFPQSSLIVDEINQREMMSLKLGVERFQLRSHTLGEIVGGWFFNFALKLLDAGAKASDRGSNDASSLEIVRASVSGMVDRRQNKMEVDHKHVVQTNDSQQSFPR
jgi:hypothetical protein